METVGFSAFSKAEADTINRALTQRFGKGQWSHGGKAACKRNMAGNYVFTVQVGGNVVESVPEADFRSTHFEAKETVKVEITPNGDIVST